jgi:hypothetical protein
MISLELLGVARRCSQTAVVSWLQRPWQMQCPATGAGVAEPRQRRHRPLEMFFVMENPCSVPFCVAAHT